MTGPDEVEQQRGVLAAITITAAAEVIPGQPDQAATFTPPAGALLVTHAWHDTVGGPDQPAVEPQEQEDR